MRPVILVSVVLATLRTGLAAPIDLSGTWVPDPAAYERHKELKVVDPKAPPAPPAPSEGKPALRNVRISHHGSAMVFEHLGDDGSPVSLRRVTTDGMESVNGADGALPHVSISRWEGRSLLTAWRLTRAGADIMTGIDTWSLSDDGGTLTLTSAMEDSKSRSRTRTVYRRQ
jgi:hypothetical protein